MSYETNGASNTTAPSSAPTTAVTVTREFTAVSSSVTRGFHVLKQWSLQKLGRAETTEEGPEFVACRKRFEATRLGLDDLHASTSAFVGTCCCLGVVWRLRHKWFNSSTCSPCRVQIVLQFSHKPCLAVIQQTKQNSG
jgi:hypothetical protein